MSDEKGPVLPPVKLVLASTSPTRRALLHAAGLRFEVEALETLPPERDALE